MVRSTAVAGVFRILSTYWEMIPADVIQSLISKIILELVWDASSADVRENVIKVCTEEFLVCRLLCFFF